MHIFHRPTSRLTSAFLLAVTLLLNACSDPAPGERVDQRPMHGPAPEIVSLEQALQSPVIPTVDLGTMHAAEIEKSLGNGPLCFFAYSVESPPVLAVSNAQDARGRGVIKIHGKLVELEQEQAPDYHALAQPALLGTPGAQVRIALASDGDADALNTGREYPADAVFTLEQGLKVGYRGWYHCTGQNS